jgi:hypothetical protein
VLVRNRIQPLLVAFVATFLRGCATPSAERQPEIILVQPSPVKSASGEVLERFFFGGIYQITNVERFHGAEDLAGGRLVAGVKYYDGAIQIILHPVPYGVRVEISNNRAESLILDGGRCGMIDLNHVGYAGELRRTTAVYPDREPGSQSLNIAPNSILRVDLDVISPAYRSQINESARSNEERGAYIAVDAPLPVFCSGFFMYPHSKPDVDRVRQWAIGRQFGVHLHFRSERTIYEYIFWITPIRFASGPKDDDAWNNPSPTPIVP